MKCINSETGEAITEGDLDAIIDKLWKGDWLDNGEEENKTENTELQGVQL